MWKKIINEKYLTLAKYYFLGVFIAVIVYRIINASIINNRLFLNALIDYQMLKLIITVFVGSLVGGIVYLLMAINDKKRNLREEKLWKLHKQRKVLPYLINIFAFAVGGFVSISLNNYLNLTNSNNKLNALFSAESLAQIIGFVVAMIVFSIFITSGIRKRLHLLFEKKQII